MSERITSTFYHFPWQLLLQPVRLPSTLAARHWDLGLDPLLWRLVSRWRDGLPFVVLLLGWIPAVTLVLTGALLLTPLPRQRRGGRLRCSFGRFRGHRIWRYLGHRGRSSRRCCLGRRWRRCRELRFWRCFRSCLRPGRRPCGRVPPRSLVGSPGSAVAGIVWGAVMAHPEGVFTEGLGALRPKRIRRQLRTARAASARHDRRLVGSR